MGTDTLQDLYPVGYPQIIYHTSDIELQGFFVGLAKIVDTFPEQIQEAA